MKSLLIEFLRPGDPSTGMLRKDDGYLAAVASHPVQQFKMQVDHARFLDLVQPLRYKPGPLERETALREIGVEVTAILAASQWEKQSEDLRPLQLDLVVNPVELAALPFEAVMDQGGEPLLVRRDRPIILTRRLRGDFVETIPPWPPVPRILFAWACPPGAGVDVPFQEHEAALLRALEALLPPGSQQAPSDDSRKLLTTLPEASLASLQTACEQAIKETRPFTYVHLLAHGCPIGRGHRQRFGMALHGDSSDDLQAVPPEELRRVLAPENGPPLVVTLATCDAANDANTLVPEHSVARELHAAGVPIVVGSQFPLTVPGSSLMVETFYRTLLAGEDVRTALYQTRCALYDKRARTYHDWASLVGYVRLPEGYADHLVDVRLQFVMQSLRAVQSHSDDLVKSGQTNLALFEDVAQQLQQRIAQLRKFLPNSRKVRRTGVLEENLGLLGSAEKRLAELTFAVSRIGGAAAWQTRSTQALKRAWIYYRRAYKRNLSHHWTGVQSLALEAVLTGKIQDPGRWHAAVTAAALDRRKPAEYWALGTLAELYLLAPLAGQQTREEAAEEMLEEMKVRVRKQPAPDPFPLESTARQLRRYLTWWTPAQGYLVDGPDLATPAARLLDVLQR